MAPQNHELISQRCDSIHVGNVNSYYDDPHNAWRADSPSEN